MPLLSAIKRNHWSLWMLRITQNGLHTKVVIEILLGVFAQFQKATISYTTYVCSSVLLSNSSSVRPFVYPHGITWLPLEGFFDIDLILKNFWKIYRETSAWIKIGWEERGTFHEDRYTFFIISRPVILRTWNVPYEMCRENQKTHFISI
jgi:hypothetical protein